jgi:hypothetical protein
MKVKELIKELQEVDGDRIVIIQKDAEGNGYSPLTMIDDESTYLADSTWSGEVGIEKLTQEDRNNGYSEDDVIGGIPALILVPVN